MSIGKQIKAMRKIRGLTQKELAEKLNISQAALTSRFKQENISINNLLELCDALNIYLDINFIDKDEIT